MFWDRRDVRVAFSAELRVLKTLIRRTFHVAGGLRAMRRRTLGQLRILMYHRFPDALGTELEWQCEQIRRSYCPISLAEAGKHLRGTEPIPPNGIVITVDDGYGDFFDVAYPIFRSFQIPVTVFLTTGFLDGAWMWGDSVLYCVGHTRAAQVLLPVPSGEPLSFNLQTAEQRREAATQIKATAKGLTDADRRLWIAKLPETLEVDLPRTPPDAFAPLSWNEVRRMAEHVDFGAHTKTHPILSRMENTEDLKEEILGSKQRIEHQLQRTVPHFCYPNGLRRDVDERVLQVTRDAGFEAAVMAEPGLNSQGTDVFQLRRIPVDPSHSRDRFLEAVAGFRL